MIISIIGCTSLIATYLIESLCLDSQVHLKLFGRSQPVLNIVTDKIKFFQFAHPINLLPLHELLESDVVIYCAATGVQASDYSSEKMIYEVNAFLPISIVSFLNENNFSGKWISFGSCFEIGNNDTFHFFTEEEIITSRLAVPNSYCISKRILTRFLDSVPGSLKWIHLLLPTIYGKKESKLRLIPYIVASLKNEIIPKLSFGKQIRQYVHSSDLISLINLLLASEVSPGVYNVAGNDSMQISELIKIVFSKFNRNAEEALGLASSRDEMMKVLLLDASKIRIHVPLWEPQISLSEGIDEYIFQ